ncbi:hypothetical protein F2Q70_00042086 [Brassica cretica]|uniref:choline-phosphate cytidylyltransferase n=1 Tax=Brassica cretica TaxID=69181 RepID=A0A8S9K9A4_BRACR|nr:hypothetical protein F2Q70_00042086 [Brassica cretica]
MTNVAGDRNGDGLSTAVTENSPPSDPPIRVYADGIYDLFHFGHARSLEQAKKSLVVLSLRRMFPHCSVSISICVAVTVYMFVVYGSHGDSISRNEKVHSKLEYGPVRLPIACRWQVVIRCCRLRFPNTYLLVGCCNDDTTHKYKGKTVMNDQERYESLRHCKWVDEVIPDAPWVINQEFLDKHRIAYVAHDALPYADASGAGKDVYEFVKKVGRFKETKRTEGISTSDIIMRIVKDYNQYVMRNLDRGYSREDLGVSFVKEKRLRVNMRLKKFQEKVKEQQEKVGEKIQTVKMVRNEWVDNADRWVAGFLEMFEEGCHKMGTAIRDRIQEKLMRQESKELLEKGQNGQHKDTEEQFYEEYFEHDIVDSCEDNEDDEEECYDEIEEQCSSASKALKSN